MAETEAHTGSAPADGSTPDPDPLGTHSPDLGGTTTLKSGSLFLVTQTSGDMPGPSARTGPHGLGLYFHDTRFLHEKRMHVNGRPMTLLFESADRGDRCTRELTNPELPVLRGEGTIHREVIGLHVDTTLNGEVREVLTFRNFSRERVEVTLTLAYGADFGDMFSVRGMKPGARGRLDEPHAEDGVLRLGYTGADHRRRTTEITFDPPPASIGGACATFHLALDPGRAQRLEVIFRLADTPLFEAHDGLEVSPEPGAMQATDASGLLGLPSSRVRLRTSNELFNRVMHRSFSDLAMLETRQGGDVFFAAGVPWYVALFGRDSIITALETLAFAPDVGRATLMVLARHQGRERNPDRDEEPGKILHELRVGEMAQLGEVPFTPYYGTVDATPLFVIVCDAAYHVTADVAFVREMRGPLLAALGWIDRHSQKGTQLVSYRRRSARGLDNQGWKDSRAGVSFPDGRRAEPPIALCEVQGYCADAYQRGARLLSVLGEKELAETYGDRAEALRALAEDRLWLPEQGRYAYAIDGRGRALDTIVSNVGHLLWSRTANPDRAIATAQLLMAPPSFSGFGIRTLATDQPVYNPLSYHNGTVWPHDNALIAKGFANYGMTREASVVFEGMMHAAAHFRDRRLPELFCGMPRSSGSLVRYPVACSPQAWASAAPFLLLQASLGLHIDAPNRLMSIENARLPVALEWLELDGIRVGQSRVSLRLRRRGERVHIERLDVSGPAIRTEIEID